MPFRIKSRRSKKTINYIYFLEAKKLIRIHYFGDFQKDLFLPNSFVWKNIDLDPREEMYLCACVLLINVHFRSAILNL